MIGLCIRCGRSMCPDRSRHCRTCRRAGHGLAQPEPQRQGESIARLLKRLREKDRAAAQLAPVRSRQRRINETCPECGRRFTWASAFTNHLAWHARQAEIAVR